MTRSRRLMAAGAMIALLLALPAIPADARTPSPTKPTAKPTAPTVRHAAAGAPDPLAGLTRKLRRWVTRNLTARSVLRRETRRRACQRRHRTAAAVRRCVAVARIESGAMRRRVQRALRVARARRRVWRRSRMLRARMRRSIRASSKPRPLRLLRQRRVGWGPGETLTFKVHVRGIETARSAIAVGAVGRASEGRTVKIRALGETIPFISTIYRMSEEIRTLLALSGLRTLTSREKRVVRKHKRWITTQHVPMRCPRGARRCGAFTRAKLPMLALHVARRKRAHWRHHRMPWHVFDPVGALFHLRSTPLSLERKLVFPMLSGTALYRVELTVAARERLRTRIGAMTCWRIEGFARRILSNGVAYPRRKNRRVTFWLSADARRIPVKISGASKLGAVVAHISSYRPARRQLVLRPRAVTPMGPLPILPDVFRRGRKRAARQVR